MGVQEKQKLYTFNWQGGGCNQVYAFTEEEAKEKAKAEWGDSEWGERIGYNSFRVVEDEDAYYRALARMCD